MLAKKKRLSPAQKNTRVFLKERISFYKLGFEESKKQKCNALEERRALKIQIGTKEPSKKEAERLKFLAYVAEQSKKQAKWCNKRKLKWAREKNALFPVS